MENLSFYICGYTKKKKNEQTIVLCPFKNTMNGRKKIKEYR